MLNKYQKAVVKRSLQVKYIRRQRKRPLAETTALLLILSRYSYLHWQNVFFAFPFPEFESVQTIKLKLHSSYRVKLQCRLSTTQKGSRTTVTSKLKLFVTIFDSFHSLKIFTKVSILDVANVLHPTFITDIFALQSWILISLRPISPLYRNQSINSNGKKDGWLL